MNFPPALRLAAPADLHFSLFSLTPPLYTAGIMPYFIVLGHFAALFRSRQSIRLLLRASRGTSRFSEQLASCFDAQRERERERERGRERGRERDCALSLSFSSSISSTVLFAIHGRRLFGLLNPPTN